MSSTAKPTKAAALAHVQALIAGTQKHFPSVTLTFGNASIASATLVTLFQSLADALTALDAAEASAKDAMAGLRATQAKVGPSIKAFESFVRATFGSATQTLADFGMQPPKARTPLTSEQKAAKALKVRATRKLLGTKGSKQKAAVKATVEAPAPPVVVKLS